MIIVVVIVFGVKWAMILMCYSPLLFIYHCCGLGEMNGKDVFFLIFLDTNYNNPLFTKSEQQLLRSNTPLASKPNAMSSPPPPAYVRSMTCVNRKVPCNLITRDASAQSVLERYNWWLTFRCCNDIVKRKCLEPV